MAELRNFQYLEVRLMTDAMIAALCCVAPFLREYVTNATTPFISRVNI